MAQGTYTITIPTQAQWEALCRALNQRHDHLETQLVQERRIYGDTGPIVQALKAEIETLGHPVAEYSEAPADDAPSNSPQARANG